MPYRFLDIAVTPSVKAVQAKMGADHVRQDFKGHREFTRFTENEWAFIADHDHFLHGDGFGNRWPYMQHRGGPRGFLKMIDERTSSPTIGATASTSAPATSRLTTGFACS